MIRKITVNEYLKRVDNMTSEERQAYLERVGKWLCSNAAQRLVRHMGDPGAQLQNVMVCSTGWNDKECEAFEEGVQLLTAVVHSEDTWLPDMLYVKAAKRVIRRMTEMLKRVFQEAATDIAVKEGKESAEGATKSTQAVGEGSQTKTTIKMGGANTVTHASTSTTTTELKPVRPRHIDQYIHLLPPKTQEHAAQVKDLLREFDESRETLRKLMDDNTVGAAVREAWAKKVTGIDNKIRKIYDELDAEWDKLVEQGRVVLDDLGNAHIVECPADEGAPQPAPELTKEQKAKRKNLRKWLCDMRYGNGATREDYVKRWRENFKEYLLLEGDKAFDDEKIKTSAEHYGVDIEEFKNK